MTHYHDNEVNHCPGCGRAQWIIGRVLAECAFCSTAIYLNAPVQYRPTIKRIGNGGGRVSRIAA